MATDIAAIKARRDWREGRDLSQFEVRLDDECLAKHYAEDVTFLLTENERLRTALEGVLGALSVWRPVQPVPDPTDCSSGYPGWVRKAWSHAIDVLGGGV